MNDLYRVRMKRIRLWELANHSYGSSLSSEDGGTMLC
jgi:hypothetical protein